MRFGTDGIRGKANTELTCEFALKLGRALSEVFNQSPILIGRDNRLSSDMLFYAVSAGLCSGGSTAIDLKVVPTPAVAYIASVVSLPAIVISASHNPYHDNGIKVIGPDGIKVNRKTENDIENLIDLDMKDGLSTDSIAKAEDGADQVSIWESMLVSNKQSEFQKLRVVVDCANGATSLFAPRILESLGADITAIFTEQNGYSINAGCGATDTAALAKVVVDTKSDLGIAFDGDGDRIVLTDEKGNTIDGDRIIALYAEHLIKRGTLRNNGVVVTSMTNLGFALAMDKLGVNVKRCDVGDRNVIELMLENDYILGGEQSGHIIRKDITCTGDGILNAILLLNILNSSHQKPSEIFSNTMTRFPQKLINLKLTQGQYQKVNEITSDAELNGLIDSITESEAGAFRAVVRPSGTEKLLRIMVEAKSDALVESYLAKISDMASTVIDKISS